MTRSVGSRSASRVSPGEAREDVLRPGLVPAFGRLHPGDHDRDRRRGRVGARAVDVPDANRAVDRPSRRPCRRRCPRVAARARARPCAGARCPGRRGPTAKAMRNATPRSPMSSACCTVAGHGHTGARDRPGDHRGHERPDVDRDREGRGPAGPWRARASGRRPPRDGEAQRLERSEHEQAQRRDEPGEGREPRDHGRDEPKGETRLVPRPKTRPRRPPRAMSRNGARARATDRRRAGGRRRRGRPTRADRRSSAASRRP